MKPTIYDVAKEAGVAISTVSKVINKTGSIGKETKMKVLDTIRKLEYQPSVVASALTKKRIQTIGLLVPNIANPFMAEIARSIEDCGRALGFSLIICSTDNDLDKEIEYISILKQKYIDGIIIATGLKNDNAIKELIDSKIPVVMLSRDVPSLAVNTVVVDDFLGAYQATWFLKELEHEKIAMITEDVNFPAVKARVLGYQEALEEAGIRYDEKLVIKNNATYIDGIRAAQELLNLPDPPTAIFASTEVLAIGAIRGARELGFHVPKDLSVVGFDDTILASMFDPPITTVAQPIHDMGKKVIELLCDEINESKKVKQRIVLSPELVVRGTTSRNEKSLS
ncbi:substrate-binding domain-containing protein [Paenibacillus sp. LMG 31456]|uniref:Substrate-binding domain-containing protein n=1 Tax=Paenibacillus foliorum TaxID=2654974 RepID=A0A972GSY0_9BACL|nr:LacI family DNA-binding transcriptional regulator [Paenibacillus foliorum]NOU95758.1 substrate-binding domain-containing protein [Paenibacillus foliorum]